MIITRLALRDFRRFGDYELALGPGLTVVCGPNEAGKSTLQHALLTGFFGKPSTSAKAMLDMQRWGASDRFAITVEFDVDGGHWRLVKDFQTRRALLERLDGERAVEAVDDLDEIQDRIVEWLGCPTGEFFRSTAFVAHDDLAGVDKEIGQLTQRLQELVSGGEDASAPQAIARLDDATRALRKGGRGTAKSLGVATIAYWEHEIETKEAMRRELADAVEVHSQRATDHVDAQARLDVLEAERVSLRQVVADADALARLDSEIEVLEEPYHKLERARELSESIGKAEATVRERAGSGTDRDALSELLVLAASAEAADRAAAQATVAAQAAVLQGGPARSWSSRVAAAAGVVLALAGIAVVIKVGSWGWALAAAGALLVGVGSWFAVGARRTAEAKNRDLADRFIAEARRAAHEAHERLGASLATAGVANLEEAKRRLSESDPADKAIEGDKARLDEVLAGEELQELDRRAKGNALALRQARDAREQLAARVPRPEDVRSVRDRLGAVDGEFADARAGVERLSVALEVVGTDPDALVAVEESLSVARERLSVLQRRLRVYERAKSAMQAAQSATMTTVTPRLEEAIGRYVSLITDGRYHEADVDEKDLHITAIAPETGAAALVDGDLSRGTRDQFYLAARVGLVGLVCGEARPPLVLDEPLTGFDEKRASKTWELLTEIARDYQVIVFTCAPSAPAGTVVRLPAPAEGQ